MVLELFRWLFGPYDPDDLSRLLRKAIIDPDLRPHFYMSFLESEIVFISSSFTDVGLNEEKEVLLKAGESISIKQYINEHNEVLIPIFSSLQVLQRHIQEEEYYVIMKGIDFLQLVQGQKVILNSGERYYKEFNPNEIEELLKMALGKDYLMAVAPSDDITFCQPEELPEELLTTLSHFFETNNEVKAAYFALFQDNTSGEVLHPLIVIDIDSDNEELLYEAAELAREYSSKGIMIDFTVLNEDDEEFYHYFHSVGPFYERNKSITRH